LGLRIENLTVLEKKVKRFHSENGVVVVIREMNVEEFPVLRVYFVN
jgi:hypothetical protein